LIPWVFGFITYELFAPTLFTDRGAGWTTWWTDRQAELHLPTGWSASLVSLVVAAVLTLVVGIPPLRYLPLRRSR